MNYYVTLMRDVIDYIEACLCEKLVLGEVAERFGFSEYHFNRIFKAVVGISLKQYIGARKLTEASKLLREKVPVIDVAFQFGFEYPEVFSRAFKKQFGFAPSSIVTFDDLQEFCRAKIVERDIINYKGVLALKGEYVFLQGLDLEGVSLEVDTKAEDFKDSLKEKTEAYLLSSQQDRETWDVDSFYTVVSCHGEDSSTHTVFCGRRRLKEICPVYAKREIPEGWYAEFHYRGDMFAISEAFVEDLYRWMIVKEAKPLANGIGMINCYSSGYPHEPDVRILIPIKRV